MKILVACEESQEVTKSFRNKGHLAFSFDIQQCSGGNSEWHIMGDVLEVINDGWDMMIAHPPCTYLSNAGARHLYKGHELNLERYEKGLQAKEFFMKLYNCNIPKICIENPLPSKIYNLPMYSEIIQPYEFGHEFSKKTLLWLKNLPGLMPTQLIYLGNVQSTKVVGNWFNKGSHKERQKIRSKTFSGIAATMAEQWG